MLLSDLDFSYPSSLIATEPSRPSRIMAVDIGVTADSTLLPQEWSMGELLNFFREGDVLVLNNTRVLPRRIFSLPLEQAGERGERDALEILFLKEHESGVWDVLFPSKKYKIGDHILLPEISMELIEKGRPQKVRLSQPVKEEYFSKYGELPLPPYIQKARARRHSQEADQDWYQTVFAKVPGSFAAPTASLHFQKKDLDDLQKKGVVLVELTLHVGLGTFLPVTVADLNDHRMHEEWFEVPDPTWQEVVLAKQQGRRVFALGTTATRALESVALGKISGEGRWGNTDLLIQPPFQFQIVDVLLTNFHQPASTLLALVSAFAGLKCVKKSYEWAIAQKFRLFSYGDLSVWIKPTSMKRN